MAPGLRCEEASRERGDRVKELSVHPHGDEPLLVGLCLRLDRLRERAAALESVATTTMTMYP